MVEHNDFPLYVVFFLENDQYGISIDSVVQIVHMVAITVITPSPEWLTGVIGYRGRIIPVIDLRVRFKKKTDPIKLNTPILIVQSGKQIAGLIVDSIKGISPLRIKNLQSPQELTIEAEFITAITNQDERVTVIPNIPKILHGTQKFDSTLNPDVPIIKSQNGFKKPNEPSTP